MRLLKYVYLVAGIAIVPTGWATGAQAFSAQLPDPMDFGVVYEKLAFEAADTNGNDLVSEGEFVRDAAVGFSRTRPQPRRQADGGRTRTA